MSRLLSRTLGLAAVVLSASAGLAAAESPYRGWGSNSTPGIDRRQAIQNYQIERGRANGSLTGREYAALKAEQARIADLERRAKADGVVTYAERARIRSAQQDAARHIYSETHDRDTAGRNRGHGHGRGWGFGRWW
jgi:hypothetical protein